MKHRIIGSRWKLTMIISSIFLTLNTVVFGVPLSMSYSNQVNIKNEHSTQEKERDDKKLADFNCIVNGSKYREGEHVPGAGPCEECICHPPNIECSMMKCPVNSGCITIQLPNKCCPKYKCDCEHNGRLYNNGEKINKSDESACRVCFCNGGEIVCTSIICYTRNDCQGYYLPGDCCPKYDNCSSTLIEQKPRKLTDFEKSTRKNIYYWSQSTEKSYDDSIWKRDTESIQKHELPTVPNVITMTSPIDTKNIYKSINISLPNDFFEELGDSNSNLIFEKNITLNETDNEVNDLHNSVTGITVDDFNLFNDTKTSFLGFETDNLTTEEIPDSSLITNNTTSDIIAEFEELFYDSTTDIDSSVVITHQNGTETIIYKTEPTVTEEIFNSSPKTTISKQVEVFNPNDLKLETKRPILEFSTVTSETTDMDYDGLKEATTPRTPYTPTIDTPNKIILNSQKSIEDEVNTEILFTNLEDTTDMFGPNFGQGSHKTHTHNIIINLDTSNSKIKEKTFTPPKLSNSQNTSEIITESTQNKLFNQSSTNSNTKSFKSNMKFNSENISLNTNKTNEIYNDTNIQEMSKQNTKTCVNNNCTNNLKYNELLNSQTESTLITPFTIETKVLPNQSPPRVIVKKIQYPKEYPEEYETIQNGPSLTITKRTYTSIPDIIYTTTTMITLPTLDLIYKADKEIEKYLSEMQSTTVKPSNNLSPLRNASY